MTTKLSKAMQAVVDEMSAPFRLLYYPYRGRGTWVCGGAVVPKVTARALLGRGLIERLDLDVDYEVYELSDSGAAASTQQQKAEHDTMLARMKAKLATKATVSDLEAITADSLTSAVTLSPTQYQLLARISERGLTGDASGSDYMALEGAGLIAIAGTSLIVTEAGQAALTFSFGGYSVVIRQVGWGDDHSPFYGDDTWQAWIEEPENRFASWVPLADLVASKAATEAAA